MLDTTAASDAVAVLCFLAVKGCRRQGACAFTLYSLTIYTLLYGSRQAAPCLPLAKRFPLWGLGGY